MNDIPQVMLTEPPKPFEKPEHRRALRLLRMISILHGKGFHGLRLYPRLTGAGAYRFYVFPCRYADKSGLYYDSSQPNSIMAGHSNSGLEFYFEKIKGEGLSAHELAIRFIDAFPELVKQSKLNDYAYVGWFTALLARSEYGSLPMVSDYSDDIDMITLDNKNSGVFPMPPPPPQELDYEVPANLVGIRKAIVYFQILQRQLEGESTLSRGEISKHARHLSSVASEKKFRSNANDLDFAIEMARLLPDLTELMGSPEDAKSILVQFIEIERKAQLES